MPRAARSKRLAAAALASACCWPALAGCSASKTAAAATTTVPATTTTTTVLNNLRQVIFDQLPASYVEHTVGDGFEGPLDLAATGATVNPNEITATTALLQMYGFKAAYERLWSVPGTVDGLIIRVQLMGSAFEAMEYFNALTFVDKASGLVPFSTAGLANSRGFSENFTLNAVAAETHFVDLIRGPLFYHIAVVGSRGSSSAVALSIAGSQSAEAAALGFT